MIYIVSTSALQATAPRGEWHATTCPGDPTRSICVVIAWADLMADAEWETAVSPLAIRPEQLGALVPPAAVTLFGAWGVATTDTGRQALQKIRQQWPTAAYALAPRR